MTEKYQPVPLPKREEAGTQREDGFGVLTFQECQRRQGEKVIALLNLQTEDDFRAYVAGYSQRLLTSEDDAELYSAIQQEYVAVYDGIPIEIWRAIYGYKGQYSAAGTEH